MSGLDEIDDKQLAGDKWTLDSIRRSYHLTVTQIAEASGLDKKVVSQAILSQPISKEQAQKICASLPKLTGKQWKPGHVDIALWEYYRILWIVRASAEAGNRPDKYKMVYAYTEKQAARLVARWLATLPDFPIHTFTPCQDGLEIEKDLIVPGYREWHPQR